MGGVIVGGPDVVDTIATQQYSNNGIALPALNVRQLLARPTNRPSRFVFHSIFREGGSIIARAAWGKKDHIVERRLPPASTG